MARRNLNKDMWEEIKILQPIIDKIDTITIHIKTWFVTVFIAIIGLSITSNRPELLKLNLVVIVSFYVAEVAYRTAHHAFLTCSRELQAILRRKSASTRENRSPNLDKHLEHTWREWMSLSAVYWAGFITMALLVFGPFDFSKQIIRQPKFFRSWISPSPRFEERAD